MVRGLRAGIFRPANKQADQDVYEALASQCWDDLWRYAYRTTGNRDDAEDLLSETLIEGFRAFPRFRGETTFVRWMMRIMTTTRIDMVRRAKRRPSDSLDALVSGEDGAPLCDIPDNTADPERRIIDPMMSEVVQSALDALPEEYRAVVILADLEQYDYGDIAGILRIPIGTVRSRLHRGRQQLRVALAEHVNPR
jgi:RNA polymerase sigma-70 factor, ECF subfamily